LVRTSPQKGEELIDARQNFVAISVSLTRRKGILR